MREFRNNKYFFHKIPSKSFGIILFFIVIFLFFSSLISLAKNNNKYLYLPKHRNTTPIFLKTDMTASKLQHGTKIAQKRVRSSISKAKRKAIEGDSTGENKVISLIEKNGVFELKLQIKETNRKIMITVYNLLAKKVLDVYHGYPHKDSEIPYYLRTSTLSEGIYLCIIQGENFRLLKKFIVSR